MTISTFVNGVVLLAKGAEALKKVFSACSESKQNISKFLGGSGQDPLDGIDSELDGIEKEIDKMEAIVKKNSNS